MTVTDAQQFADIETQSELLAIALRYFGAEILPGESAITAAARVLTSSKRN
jgi:hypothetical protein